MKVERIVFVHPFLLHYHLPRLQALAEECRKAGILFHNIELASHMGTYRSFVENAQTRFSNVTLFPKQSLESIPTNRTWLSLRKSLDELRPDVLFIYGYSLGVMRSAKFWAERHGIPTVMISDSNEFDKRRYRILEFPKSLFVSRVDAAFVGGTNSSLYLEKLGIPRQRIVLGYDVIDNRAFCQQADQNRTRIIEVRHKWNLPESYFLYVGRIIKEKNLRGLLDAYMEYAESIGRKSVPWSLVICGSGPEEEELRQHAHSVSGQSGASILFYGPVHQPDIIDFYSAASCFVLPSISESWGLVINEAMACGLPVISSRKAGCAADLVKDGVTGWLFDPFDLHELARLMLNVHSVGSSARIEMGEQGRHLISEWGLERFSQGALESAQVALRHRNRSWGCRKDIPES